PNVSADHSLIGVADAGNFTLIGAGNQKGSLAKPLDAKLGPLQDNGGPTQTHNLLAGSPCIDQGSNLGGLTTDQRGAPTVRNSGEGVDIGAIEVQKLVVVNDNDSGAGSLRQAVLIANFFGGADSITF